MNLFINKIDDSIYILLFPTTEKRIEKRMETEKYKYLFMLYQNEIFYLDQKP